MVKETFLLNMSDKLEIIEDGINAARALAAARNNPVGSTMTIFDYKNAEEWIFNHILDDLKLAQEDVSSEMKRKKNA